MLPVLAGLALLPVAGNQTDAPPPAEPQQTAQAESAAPESPAASTQAPAPAPQASNPESQDPSAEQVGPIPVEAIEEKILALRGTIKSFTANIDVRFDSSQGEAWVKSHTFGPMAYLFEDDKILYRIDMTIETTRIAEGAEEKTVEPQTMMSDGEYMYQIGERNGRKAAYKARIDKLQSSVPTPEFFFFLHRDYDLSLLPDEEVDGKPCWVIRAAKISDEEVLRIKTITYFRQDIPLMVKTVNLDRFDNVMQVTQIKDIQVDVPVDRAQFEFRPEPDWEVMDQSTW